MHQRPAPAASASWTNIVAVGGSAGTPIGMAFECAQGVLDDGEMVPTPSCNATLVLVYDGRPTVE
jgi:hypothetical protein